VALVARRARAVAKKNFMVGDCCSEKVLKLRTWMTGSVGGGLMLLADG
jgi:hypothetical protein